VDLFFIHNFLTQHQLKFNEDKCTRQTIINEA
jgi:hypothetical protein